MGADPLLTWSQQARFHNGGRFRRQRRIDLVPRPRMPPSLHSAMQPTRPEPRAAVELALTVAEEAVAVAQIEAEEEKLAEHRSHTRMGARKLLIFQPLRLSQLLGMHLLLAIRGILRRQAMIPGTLQSLQRKVGARPLLQPLKRLSRRPQLLFQLVSRRAGQACLHLLHPPQRRRQSQLLRSTLHRIPPIV